MSVGKLDEKGGYFYEALLRYALNRCKNIPQFVMHEKLGNLAVVSDVIIPAASNPKVVILVTHSFSENGTHMKTWRNIDEMLFIREHFPQCAIINMLFPSEWKKNLVEIMDTICDYQFTFPDKLGKTVTNMALKAIEEDLRSQEAYDSWISSHAELKPAIKYICDTYNDLFENENLIDSKWAKYSEFSSGNRRRCNVIYAGDYPVKKGLMKMALLSADERSILFDYKNKPKQIPESTRNKFLRYGILTTGISVRIADVMRPSLFSVPREIVEESFSLMDDLYSDEVQKMLQPLNGYDGFDLDVFLARVNEKKRTEQIDLFQNLIIEWNDKYTERINLPLYYLYAIETCINPRFSHRILSSMCDGLVGGIWPLSMLMSGQPRTSSQVRLSTKSIRKISEVFADSFCSSGLPETNEIWEKLVYLVEDKFIKNKNANYLLYLCIAKCKHDGLVVYNEGNPHIHIGNGIAKYCTDNGIIVGNDAAQTAFSFSVNYKETQFVFSVISANAATHKHKEYPARWRCANIEYKDNAFVKTTDSRKWIVILDGIWNELFADLNDTLEKFALAGASGIYDIHSFATIEDFKNTMDSILEE